MGTLSSTWNCCTSPIPSVEGKNYVSSTLDSLKHFLFLHQITSRKTMFPLNQLLSIKIAFRGGRVDSETSGMAVVPSAENQLH